MTNTNFPNNKSITLITNTQILNADETVSLVKKVLPFGLTNLQVREKSMDKLSLKKFLHKLREETKYRCKLILNGPIELALETECDGIHLPEISALTPHIIEKKPSNLIVGRSFHGLISENVGWVENFDYIQIGSVFNTESHPNSEPMDLKVLRDSCNLSTVPIIAVGGIDQNNVTRLIQYNISGIAIMRGLLLSKDPEITIKTINSILNGGAFSNE